MGCSSSVPAAAAHASVAAPTASGAKDSPKQAPTAPLGSVTTAVKAVEPGPKPAEASKIKPEKPHDVVPAAEKAPIKPAVVVDPVPDVPPSHEAQAPETAEFDDEPEETQEEKALREMKEAAVRDIAKMLKENKVHMNEWMALPSPADGDMRLLRAAASVSSSGNNKELIRFFVEAKDSSERLNDLVIHMTPLSMSSAVTALSKIMSLLDDIRGSSEAVTNSIPSGDHLLRCVKIKELWREIIHHGFMRTTRHPRLGVVPVVQPLLHSCIQRQFTAAATDSEGNGGEPNPIFDYLMSHGARVDITNSLGLTTLHQMVEAVDRVSHHGGAPLQQALSLCKTLIAAGASPDEKTSVYKGHTELSGRNVGGLEAKLTQGDDFDVTEAISLMRSKANEHAMQQLEAVLKDAVELNEEVDELLDTMQEKEEGDAAPADGVIDDLVEKVVETSTAVITKPKAERSRISATPIQTAYNSLWIAAQLTKLVKPEERRDALVEIIAKAPPFALPSMRLLPFSSIKDSKTLPRPEQELKEYIGIGDLPDRSIVAYVSMLHLTAGDAREAEQHKQLVIQLEELGRRFGGVDRLYIWAPTCCLAEDEMAAGLHGLPAYLACCGLFTYTKTPECEEDAWCRTERFLHWRMRCQHSSLSWSAANGEMKQEMPAHVTDPSLGRLEDECHRTTVVMMTALYDDIVDERTYSKKILRSTASMQIRH